MSNYNLSDREKLFHSEEFKLDGVECKMDVYGSGPHFDFLLYRWESFDNGHSGWRFVNGSDWDNRDMEMLFGHVVRTYDLELFNGRPSVPPSVPPAGVPPAPKVKPGEIPPAGTPHIQ